jgi:hypothetical protein
MKQNKQKKQQVQDDMVPDSKQPKRTGGVSPSTIGSRRRDALTGRADGAAGAATGAA